MNKDDLARWASRRAGRPVVDDEDAHPAPARTAQPPPQHHAPQVAPQASYAAPPVAPAPPGPQVPPAYRMPQGVVPYAGPVHPYPGVAHAPQAGPVQRPVETTLLVRPGNIDPYANFLATIPDLAPNAAAHYAQHDAMENNPSPESLAELQAHPELLSGGGVEAFPRAGVGAVSSAKIGSLAGK